MITESKRRFPAEWEKQDGILLCFPHNGNDWPGKYEAIQWAFVEFIKKISLFESVYLVVADEKLQAKVSQMLITAEVELKSISFIILLTPYPPLPHKMAFMEGSLSIFCKSAALSVSVPAKE